MKIYLDDTIAAISTSIGYGGIGIVRISGSGGLGILNHIFRCKKDIGDMKSHTVTWGHIVNKNGVVLDDVLVIVMLAPKTYTREDVIEINCHGGTKAVRAVLKEVLAQGARLAQPGEFTRRAFLNGRIDLSQAEAVIDIIHAKTDLSRQASVNQLTGSVSTKVKEYADEILTMIANIEASIDYPEHDLEEMNLHDILGRCQSLQNHIHELVQSADKGRMIRDGIDTVILGRPNVGKSSLLNQMLQEERAIVTDIPGTTRDLLQEYMNVNDIPLKITDTAGIRHTDDVIEKIGVEKSRQYAQQAALIFMMIDGSSPITQEDIDILESVKDKKMIVLINKSDMPQAADVSVLYDYVDKHWIVALSLKEGYGLDDLYNRLKELFFDGNINVNDEVYIQNVRHENALLNAADSLAQAMEAIESGMTEDLISIDLQAAYGYLGEVIGETLDEDIIDKIFADFCLGK